MNTSFYMYISTRADWDPVKMIFLCAPATACSTVADAEAFARKTGWVRAAEQGKCALVVPVVEGSWDQMPETLLMDLFRSLRNGAPAQQGRSIWGRAGLLWCWEVCMYAVGYEDGAAFVGQTQIANPGLLAGTAMVDGCPDDFSAGEERSCHWLVKEVSSDYAVKNKEIPVYAWFYTQNQSQVQPALDYWNGVNAASTVVEETLSEGETRKVYYGAKPAHQVSVREGIFTWDFLLALEILEECFSHVIRWKNGPDGTLALVPTREEFYHSKEYTRRTVGLNGNYYDYFVHLPKGKTVEEVKGLPLVISVHGRGEPAWMFTNKNGWESLADETGEFVTISPDSPGNIWFWTRDAKAFAMMIDQMVEEFGVDRDRVYLTGFSNGGSITRETSALFPELFAAISPWNGPAIDSFVMTEFDKSRLANCLSDEIRAAADEMKHKVAQLPAFIYYGDKDPGIGVETNLMMPWYMELNQCDAVKDDTCPAGYRPDEVRDASNYYTKKAGYEQGDRFTTYVYRSKADGQAKVCVTVMKNMPHGAITEESKAAWAFLRQFKRKLV